MIINLAPTYKKQIGEYWILWFKTSNTYSVVNCGFELLLTVFIESESPESFKKTLQIDGVYDEENHSELTTTITNYLKNCNAFEPYKTPEAIPLDISKQNITKTYRIHNTTLKVNYDIAPVMDKVHPALAHLEAPSASQEIDITFDVYTKDKKLFLYENSNLITCVPNKDYHLLQGKFITYIFGAIHHKKETDWIGTFHGSTIADGNTAIMFVGLSGKGKSTLTTLLAAHGLELVTDDVSPLLAENMEIYNNPSAISVKKGAFKILEPLIPNFENLPAVMFNTQKGFIKYVPFTNQTKLHYPCKAIISVNYQPNAKTALDKANIQDILETLIPDSWLQHNPIYAEKFLNWLGNLEFYQLTYSKTEEALKTVNTLFKGYKS